jgi:type 1 fimbria pilin
VPINPRFGEPGGNKDMRKAILAAGIAAFLLMATGAGPALADDPVGHAKGSFSGEIVSPAGTVCDFTLDDTFTVDVIFTAAPNGGITLLLTEHVTHTNLGTGYSLTETDQINQVIQPASSTAIEVGIFWHLRDASGDNVLVHAGEATLDPATGQLISFTPNSGFDQTAAQILCPALGGNPA